MLLQTIDFKIKVLTVLSVVGVLQYSLWPCQNLYLKAYNHRGNAFLTICF
jgi:hypothetical protein